MVSTAVALLNCPSGNDSTNFNLSYDLPTVKCQAALDSIGLGCYDPSMIIKSLHPLQEAILKAAEKHDIFKMSLRELGKIVGDGSPQKIKHHLQQLEKRGALRTNKHGQSKPSSAIKGFLQNDESLLRIPILGSANCGPAQLFAIENHVGYLRISTSILKRKNSKNLFALRANGYSMNRASINNKSVDDGDYLIIDNSPFTPYDGDVVLSIIEGMANIKSFYKDNVNHQVVLMSQSNEDFAPIFIHKDDDFMVNGKVVDVLKKPNQKN